MRWSQRRFLHPLNPPYSSVSNASSQWFGVLAGNGSLRGFSAIANGGFMEASKVMGDGTRKETRVGYFLETTSVKHHDRPRREACRRKLIWVWLWSEVGRWGKG